jgi:hypothetical protein
MTEKLQTISSDNFNFTHLPNTASTTGAFNDTGADIESILELLKDKKLTASRMFSGVQIKQNLGSESNPIILNWTNCSYVFSERTWNSAPLNENSSLTTWNRDYEFICLRADDYALQSFSHHGTSYNIYIKLPYATNVSCMFMS